MMRKVVFCAACVFSGWVSAFSMAPVSLWPCLFAGLSLLYVLFSRTENAAQAFAAGFFFALGYFVTGLWWIGNALLVEGNEFAWVWPISVIGLPTLLALFTGTYLGVARMVSDPRDFSGFFAFAFFLTFSEWARGNAFTGFPWNLYGYVWADHLEMAQIIHCTGAYGLTFISILWAAVAGYLYVGNRETRTNILTFLAVGATMAATYAYGDFRLKQNPTRFDPDNAVVVVQPNIPQDMKWDPVATQDNFYKTVGLSAFNAKALPEGSRPKNTFIVWPETAISPAVYSVPDNNDRMGAMLKGYTSGNAYLVTGILRRVDEPVAGREPDPQFANSVAYLNSDMKALAFYDKYNLVPFGEFIPFQKWIPLKPVAAFRGFRQGSGPATLSAADAPPFSPLICYEVIFPDDATDKHAQRPRWIVNVTNDGWYGDSAGPHQHFAQTRLRAIEEGLPVIRSANTGISGIFDPVGRVIGMAAIFTEGAVTSLLPLPLSGKNPYWPWAIQILLPAIAIFMLIRLIFRKN